MNKMLSSKYWWAILLVVLVGINYLAAFVHTRIDLTQDKRFTLSEPTRRLLKHLNEKIEVRVLLDGSMPAGFKNLRNSIQELLQEFKENGRSGLSFKFEKPGSDPSDALTQDSSLKRFGLNPTNVHVTTKPGESEEDRYLYPAALVINGDKVEPVDFLVGQDMTGGLGALNNAEALIEYKLAHAIQKVTAINAPAVGYLLDNGEPETYNVYDFIEHTLKQNYRFNFVHIDSFPFIPKEFDAIVIEKPSKKFTDKQKLKIDQYIMNGGKVIWLIDKLYAEMDSLMRSQSDFVAYDRGLNLDDLLFRYGARINDDLVQDLDCDKLPLVVGNYGNQPQMQLVPWFYFPLMSATSDNPISKNLDTVWTIFPNSLDTIKVNGIKKTFLLASSINARSLSTPAIVSFNTVKTQDDIKTFNRPNIPVAVLLEGKFSSLYTNRLSQGVLDTMAGMYKRPFRAGPEDPTKMIVISDADVAMNVVTQKRDPRDTPMGWNQFTDYQYANKDFILNCIEYLVNPSGILETRSKDITLRLLDTKKIDEEKSKWQIINIGLPIVLILLFGFIYGYLRKRKFVQ
jgi:ABC-2 type transport system permease protein